MSESSLGSFFLIDADPQGSLTISLGFTEPDKTSSTISDIKEALPAASLEICAKNKAITGFWRFWVSNFRLPGRGSGWGKCCLANRNEVDSVYKHRK